MRHLGNLARVANDGQIDGLAGKDCLALGGGWNVSMGREGAESVVVGGRVHVQVDGLIRDRQVDGDVLVACEQRGEGSRRAVLRRLGQDIAYDQRRVPAMSREDRIHDAGLVRGEGSRQCTHGGGSHQRNVGGQHECGLCPAGQSAAASHDG